jgi:hypothetical protein
MGFLYGMVLFCFQGGNPLHTLENGIEKVGDIGKEGLVVSTPQAVGIRRKDQNAAKRSVIRL